MRLTKEDLKRILIKKGIKNLEEYGFRQANQENITTNMIYSGFFESMLRDAKADAVKIGTSALTLAIDELLTEISNNENTSDI